MDAEVKVQVCQLPRRPRGPHMQKFRQVNIITNFYPVKIEPMEQIHIFRIKFTPQIQLDDRATRKALLDSTMTDIKKYISNVITNNR